MTYPEVLQTISTFTGLVGVSAAIYLGFSARRAARDVRQSVDDQTQHFKEAVKEQTRELKS